MVRPVRNKVKQCGGTACPRCRKCMDWSYDGDLSGDYKRLQLDNKGDKILDEKYWHRSPDATCCFHAGFFHCFSYCHTYHSQFCHYSCSSSCYYCSVCECEQLNNRK